MNPLSEGGVYKTLQKMSIMGVLDKKNRVKELANIETRERGRGKGSEARVGRGKTIGTGA